MLGLIALQATLVALSLSATSSAFSYQDSPFFRYGGQIFTDSNGGSFAKDYQFNFKQTVVDYTNRVVVLGISESNYVVNTNQITFSFVANSVTATGFTVRAQNTQANDYFNFAVRYLMVVADFYHHAETVTITANQQGLFSKTQRYELPQEALLAHQLYASAFITQLNIQNNQDGCYSIKTTCSLHNSTHVNFQFLNEVCDRQSFLSISFTIIVIDFTSLNWYSSQLYILWGNTSCTNNLFSSANFSGSLAADSFLGLTTLTFENSFNFKATFSTDQISLACTAVNDSDFDFIHVSKFSCPSSFPYYYINQNLCHDACPTGTTPYQLQKSCLKIVQAETTADNSTDNSTETATEPTTETTTETTSADDSQISDDQLRTVTVITLSIIGGLLTILGVTFAYIYSKSKSQLSQQFVNSSTQTQNKIDQNRSESVISSEIIDEKSLDNVLKSKKRKRKRLNDELPKINVQKDDSSIDTQN